jgi:hypothetical protein
MARRPDEMTAFEFAVLSGLRPTQLNQNVPRPCRRRESR